jgi:hypothetical protein
MPVPLERYLDRAELKQRLCRDVADCLSEAIDAAQAALVDAFCPDGAFDVDVSGEVIASVNAERMIDEALEPLWSLQTELERRGNR